MTSIPFLRISPCPLTTAWRVICSAYTSLRCRFRRPRGNGSICLHFAGVRSCIATRGQVGPIKSRRTDGISFLELADVLLSHVRFGITIANSRSSALAFSALAARTPSDQREAAERLHLPFPLLSDAQLEFASAMRLPVFDVQSMQLLKRLTLIIRDGVVEHVFYPVFPPDRNAEQVVDWLRTHQVIE